MTINEQEMEFADTVQANAVPAVPIPEQGSTGPDTMKGGDAGPNQPGISESNVNVASAKSPAPTGVATPVGPRRVYLDKTYIVAGIQYGPSKHLEDLIAIPDEFDIRRIPVAPTIETWRPAPVSPAQAAMNEAAVREQQQQ